MDTPTLLGHLARFGSFSTQSELLCTQGLTYLLQVHEDARSAMTDLIVARTGLAIDGSLTWEAEARQEDGARPDLEACEAGGVPVIKVEAKLSAELFEGQVQSYVRDLQNRNLSDSAMLVLVPLRRTSEAAKVTASALDLHGFGPWRVTDGYRTGIAVISWDDLFAALRGGKADRFNHELEQLQAMYDVLSGDFIAPLAGIEDLLQWRERGTDLLNVVDKVTRRLTTQHPVYPMGLESLDDGSHESEPRGYHRRYVCSFASDVESCFAIGVRDSFEQWVTPIWMRFRQDTGHFELIRQRIEASCLRSLESGGHIWIPLDVPFDVWSEQMIQALVEQAEEVVRIAYQAE